MGVDDDSAIERVGDSASSSLIVGARGRGKGRSEAASPSVSGPLENALARSAKAVDGTSGAGGEG